MKKEDVEEYISGAYPAFEGMLKSLENQLLTALEFYHKDKPELIKANDFRPGTLSRMLSSAIAVRFFIDRTGEFIADKNWGKTYTEKYIPQPWKGNGYFGHFKDLDLVIRFYLFHSFYHQLESTIRIICRELKLDKKIKPIERVNEITSAFPPDFIELIDAIRNSIHNNGYYQPIGKQLKDFTYKLNSFEFKFVEDSRVNFDTQEILHVIRELINYTGSLLMHKTIMEMSITPDKN